MQKTTYDALLLLSGGIDSTTALYELVNSGKRVMCLIFDYGQTLIKEVDIAIANAKRVGADFKVVKIDLDFSESACTLISDNEIAVDRSFEDIDRDVPTSYVEFRNGILLSYAVMYAECHDIHDIYGGFNGLDSGNYYDDTQQFISAFENAANAGTSPHFHVNIHAPWANKHKYEIVQRGIELGLDYNNTWSCYKNGEHHCMRCDSCKQRERALMLGGWK